MEFSLNLFLLDILLVLLTYGYIFLTIIIPVQLKKRDLISKFTARKIVHLLAGLSVLVAPFFMYPYFAILIAGSLTILTYFSSRESKVKQLKDLYDSIGEEAEEKAGRLLGPFNYCLSITILISIFVFLAPHQLYFPIAGILIMIIADTLASIVGKNWGRIPIHLPWTSTRTVLGSATMFGCSFLLCIGSFWYFGIFNPLTQTPLTWNIIVFYALITAVLATIIEIVSPSTWDDLSVPIGSTIIIYLLTFVYL
ncbi:MAG: diacylglycerol/polyprenol kinase family protein [Promethearchaeota archaeon]